MGRKASLAVGALPVTVIVINYLGYWASQAVAFDGLGLLRLVTTTNTDGAFSLPLPSVVLSVLWLILLMYCAVTTKYRDLRLPILVMIGGGASNLIDRLLFGGVRDYLQIGAAYFNLADVAIVAAAMVMVGLLLQPGIRFKNS